MRSDRLKNLQLPKNQNPKRKSSMIGFLLKIVISLKNTGGDYYDNNSLGTIKILTNSHKFSEKIKKFSNVMQENWIIV